MDNRWHSIRCLPVLAAVGLMTMAGVSSLVSPSIAVACAPARPTDDSRPGFERPDQRPCSVQPDCTCR